MRRFVMRTTSGPYPIKVGLETMDLAEHRRVCVCVYANLCDVPLNRIGVRRPWRRRVMCSAIRAHFHGCFGNRGQSAGAMRDRSRGGEDEKNKDDGQKKKNKRTQERTVEKMKRRNLFKIRGKFKKSHHRRKKQK